MINNFKLFALSTLIGIMFLVSCEKENPVTQNTTQSDNFSLIEGRLAFDNEAAFRKTLDELYSTQNALDEWEEAVSGYTSLRTVCETITYEKAEEFVNKSEKHKFIFAMVEEENGELSMERNIYNDVLATLISDKGFLQIGEKVYRFTYDYFYSTDVKDIDLLDINTIDNLNSKVIRTEIKREFVHQDESSVSLKSQTIGECINQSGSKRTRGLIVVEDVFDNDCIIMTKHQRKRFGRWWANKTSMSVQYSGNFVKIWSSCSPSPLVYFSGIESRGNSSSVSEVISGNHPSFAGCNGSATPMHDGQYTSTHIAGGKTCTLSCPPFAPCN